MNKKPKSQRGRLETSKSHLQNGSNSDKNQKIHHPKWIDKVHKKRQWVENWFKPRRRKWAHSYQWAKELNHGTSWICLPRMLWRWTQGSFYGWEMIYECMIIWSSTGLCSMLNQVKFKVKVRFSLSFALIIGFTMRMNLKQSIRQGRQDW